MKNRRLFSLLGVTLLSLAGCSDKLTFKCDKMNRIYESILKEYDSIYREYAIELFGIPSLSLKDLYVGRICGHYNGAYVLEPFYYMRSGESWGIKNRYEDSTNDVYFEDYDEKFPPIVYKDGTFYSLKDSFSNNILSKENYVLKSILRIPTSQLGSDQRGRGWQTYYVDFLNSTKYKDSTEKLVYEDAYNGGYSYGYNKNAIDNLSGKQLQFYTYEIEKENLHSGEQYLSTYTISNKSFRVIANHMPIAYCEEEGTCYTLSECYENGWIDYDDLEMIDQITAFRLDKTVDWLSHDKIFQ